MGGDDDECIFGRDEPYEDLLSFHVWCICRDRLRERLGLGKAEAPAKPASSLHTAPPPAKHPATAAPPKAMAELHPALKPPHPGQTSAPKASVSVPPALTPAPAPPVVPQPGTMFFPTAETSHAALAPPMASIPPVATQLAAETSVPAVPAETLVPPVAEQPAAETSVPEVAAETSAPPVPKQPLDETLVPAATVETSAPPMPKQPAAETPVAETSLVPVPKQHAAATPAEHPSTPAVMGPPSSAVSKAGPAHPGVPNPPASGLSDRVDKAILDVPKEAAKPTSATHRNEYMAYLRAARNPSKLPPALRSTFAAGGAQRLDLFQLWMEKGRDFSLVQVEIQRRNVQRQTATSRNLCLSRAQLMASGRYSEDDINDLVRRRTESGAWIPDPNFPDRIDLRQYLVNAETAAENARVREDSQAITSRTSASAAEAISMTEDGADFSVHAAPTATALAAELSGIEPPPQEPQQAAPKAKAKAKPRAKAKGKGKGGKGKAAGPEGEEEPEPDKVPTPLEKATTLKSKVFLVWTLSTIFEPPQNKPKYCSAILSFIQV